MNVDHPAKKKEQKKNQKKKKNNTGDMYEAEQWYRFVFFLVCFKILACKVPLFIGVTSCVWGLLLLIIKLYL